MSVPDLEKAKEKLYQIKHSGVWRQVEGCSCSLCTPLKQASILLDQALVELEREEEKEVDYTDPKNWIAGQTVIQLQSGCGNEGLFMGNSKIYLFEEKEFFTTASIEYYEFVCNLPDPQALNLEGKDLK